MNMKIQNLSVSYGAVQAVKDISFHVEEGEVITLIGANGAGKTTTLRTISGLEHAQGGSIQYNGKEILGLPPHKIVEVGIAHVPEGRRIFTNLSVLDNLRMGAVLRKDGEKIKDDLEAVFDIFPRLRERKVQLGATLSGGEQQMLAVGRALMTKANFVLLDEPSMGLAPLVVEGIFRVIERMNSNGSTVLLVEQNAFMALKTAHRAYVLETGSIVKEGRAEDLLNDQSVIDAYLGS